MRVEDLLRQLEEDLLEPSNRSNRELVASLLADEFLEFGKSGRSFDKTAILDSLLKEPLQHPVLLSNFAARSIAPDVYLVTYRTTTQNSVGESQSTNRSSIWIKRDDRWQVCFHQGTPIPKPA